MRIITDIFGFCSTQVPRWNTISVSGYHIREAGSTALQELAFTLRDGLEYVQWGVDAGLDVDDFVPRMSFFFNAHSDFFEEIAKYRAARKIWAEAMRDRFHAKSDRSWKLRFHSQTAGVSLTAQQPYNNVVRTALQALSAVLGGTNSLHTNSLDEALALPTEEAATLALRTQQIIAHESGVTNVVDPLGGSYFVERLTKDMEDGALPTSTRSIGWAGWSKRSSAAIRRRKSPKAPTGSSRPSNARRRSSSASTTSCSRTSRRSRSSTSTRPRPTRSSPSWRRWKRTRNADAVARSLDALRSAAQGTTNLMPAIIDAVRAYATVGEVCDALREVWGEYEEVPII
jgi:methylmalonyl-CoA mutase N-terminal domain/subunit